MASFRAGHRRRAGARARPIRHSGTSFWPATSKLLLAKLQEAAQQPQLRCRASARQIREGVELAVRLAELIQRPARAGRPAGLDPTAAA